MSKEAWILLYKKFLNWEWYDHPPTKDVFLHCLLSANFIDENWKGQKIKRGQFPTSVEKLATTLGLTVQQTRTALKNLQTTNEITIQTTNRYSIITVINYNCYQPNVKQGKGLRGNNKQTTNKQQAKILVNTGEIRIDENDNNKQSGGANNNTINNINKERYNKLYLSSSCNEETNLKIDDDEREILKNYVKRKKLAKTNLRGYVNKIIENGDYLDILKEEKQRLARLEQQSKEVNIPPAEKIEKTSPEVDKAGLELMRETVKQIRKRG